MSNVIASLLVKVTADTRDADSDLRRVDASFGSATKAGAGFASGMLAVEAGLRAAREGFIGTIATAANYEKAIDAVGAVAGASQEQLKGISETALRIGKDTQFGAREAAGAMEILAANGINVTDIMGGAADATATLAAAGGTNLAQAADTVSTAMAVWGANTQDLTEYVNRLAGAANVSRFGVEDMSQAIAQGGGVAAAVGVDFGDFTAVIAATSASFSSGSDAGTSFKTFLQRLSAPTGEAAKMMRTLGINAFDATGQMRPMGEIVEQLHDSLGSMSEAQRAAAASTIFGSDAMRTALGLAGMTREEYEALSQAMRDTSAQDVATARTDNLAGAWERLNGSIETIQIEIGQRLLPKLTELVDWGAEKLPQAFAWMQTNWGEAFSNAGESAALLAEQLGRITGWLSEHPEVAEAAATGIALATTAMLTFAAASLAASLVNPFTLTILAVEALAIGLVYLAQNWEDVEAAVSSAADAWVDAADSFGDSVANMADAVEDGGAAVVEWFEDLPDTIEDAIGDLGGLLYDAGADMVEGLIDGAQGKFGDLVDEVQSWPAKLVGKIQDAANGHSPWGIAKGLGEDLVGGIESGFDAVWGGLESKVASSVTNLALQAERMLVETLHALGMREPSGGALPLDQWEYYTGNPLVGPRQPIEGPFLGSDLRGMTPDQIAQANADARAALRGAMGGGYSGGGSGSGGKDAAKTAAEEFAAAWQGELDHGVLAEAFGETGASLIESFGEAFTNPRTAARLPDIIADLVDEAEEAGVPNAQQLGENLATAIAAGLESGTDTDVKTALGAMTDAVVAAGKLTVDNFGNAVSARAADRRLTDQIGSGGKSLMDAFHKAIDEGGKKNIERLADVVDSMQAKLNDKAPEAQAAYLGTSMMQALNDAISNHGPEAEARLAAVMANINAIMLGGAIDIRTGTVIAADSIKDLAKAFGTDGKTLVDNIQILIDSGITNWIGSLDDLPAAAQTAITDLLNILEKGVFDAETLKTKLASFNPGGGSGSQPGNGGPGRDIFTDNRPDGALPGETIAEYVKRLTGADIFGGEASLFDASGRYISPNDLIGAVVSGSFGRDWLNGDIGVGKNPAQSGRVTSSGFVPNAPYTPHADGLDYVPYDNYPALLHKGERVMTAEENRGSFGDGGVAVMVNIEHFHGTESEGRALGAHVGAGLVEAVRARGGSW